MTALQECANPLLYSVAYTTLDAQVNFIWNKARLKIGGTNILDTYYPSYLDGASVGGLCYSTITVAL